MGSGGTFNSGIQAIAYRLGSRPERGVDLVRDNAIKLYNLDI